jgi:hypothetical protein
MRYMGVIHGPVIRTICAFVTDKFNQWDHAPLVGCMIRRFVSSICCPLPRIANMSFRRLGIGGSGS